MNTRRKKLDRKCIRFLVLAFLTLVLVGAACAGRWIAPYDPTMTDFTQSLKPPDSIHLCGTDKLGRDVFSRILVGAGTSFALTFLMVLIVTVIGTTTGVISGYLGGIIDQVLMRLTDVLLAFPGSVFAIAVAGILGAGIFHTILALAFVWWTRYARMSRGMVRRLKNKDFLCAARFAGARDWQLIVKYILPNILPQITVMAALDVGSMMLSLAGLSFLGLAAQPPAPEWGYMLFESRQYMQVAPWMMICPGAAILLTVIVFNLLGDSVRDLLDPRAEN